MLSGEFHLQIRCLGASQIGGEEGSQPFRRSFDEVQAALRLLPELYFEEDGSFFWTNQNRGYQLWGMLYDRPTRSLDGRLQSRLEYCELRGKMNREEWEQIIVCLGEPIESLRAVELPQMAVSSLQDCLSRLYNNT